MRILPALLPLLSLGPNILVSASPAHTGQLVQRQDVENLTTTTAVAGTNPLVTQTVSGETSSEGGAAGSTTPATATVETGVSVGIDL